MLLFILSLLHILGQVFNTIFTLFTGLGLVVIIFLFHILVWTTRRWMEFFMTIVKLFIFRVGLVIYLGIPSITSFLGEIFSLWFNIYWNGWIGVLGQKKQIILPSLRVPFILSSVVIVYLICSIPRHPLRSHSLLCSENYLYIAGIVPIHDKEL